MSDLPKFARQPGQATSLPLREAHDTYCGRHDTSRMECACCVIVMRLAHRSAMQLSMGCIDFCPLFKDMRRLQPRHRALIVATSQRWCKCFTSRALPAEGESMTVRWQDRVSCSPCVKCVLRLEMAELQYGVESSGNGCRPESPHRRTDTGNTP